MISRRAPLDSRIERKAVTAMIVNDDFLRMIQEIITENSFTLPFAKTISDWCIEYFQEFKEAPRKNIQEIFANKISFIAPETVDAIREFLVDISDEYLQSNEDNLNVNFLLKEIEKHFRLANLKGLKDEINKCLMNNDVENAESKISSFRRITRPESRGIDILRSTRSIVKALSPDDLDVVINIPGALGKEVGPIRRGDLFSIVAGQGVGKTWWLMYIALRAWIKGYNVLFVSLEMNEKQMLIRIYSWLTGLPSIPPDDPTWIKLPVFDCLKNQTGECQLPRRACNIRLLNQHDDKPSLWMCPREYKPCTACYGKPEYQFATWWKAQKYDGLLTIDRAIAKRDAIIRSAHIKGKFKLQGFPSRGISMEDFKIYLQNLEYYENFIPDLIVTDYADKFKRPFGEYRHGINDIWEDHKGLAQEKNIAVVTASQSNTARTGKKIKQGDWAEDIRKLGLVDSGFAINMTAEEEQSGIYRCGVLKRRTGKADRVSEIIVLHQLEIGKPYLGSMKLFNGRNL